MKQQRTGSWTDDVFIDNWKVVEKMYQNGNFSARKVMEHLGYGWEDSMSWAFTYYAPKKGSRPTGKEYEVHSSIELKPIKNKEIVNFSKFDKINLEIDDDHVFVEIIIDNNSTVTISMLTDTSDLTVINKKIKHILDKCVVNL